MKKFFSVFCNEKAIVIDYHGETELVPQSSIIFDNIKDKYTFGYLSWFSVFITILVDAILILTSIRCGLDHPIFLSCVTFAFIGSISFFNALEKIILLNFTKEGRKVSRIHSALHKAINAMIQEDSLTPSIENIQKASRFNCYCHSIYTLENILIGFLAIPVILLTHKQLWLCLISLIILRSIIRILLSRGVFNFFQILFLRKPTREEVETVSLFLRHNYDILHRFHGLNQEKE